MSISAWEYVVELENSQQDLFQVQFLKQPVVSAISLHLENYSRKGAKQQSISVGHWAGTGTFFHQTRGESSCAMLQVQHHRNQKDLES